jgi:hypothetical protein
MSELVEYDEAFIRTIDIPEVHVETVNQGSAETAAD